MIAVGSDGDFDLDLIARRLEAAGITKRIGISAIQIGSGALDHLPALVTRLQSSTSSGPVVILDDGVPKLRHGKSVVDLVASYVGGSQKIRRVAMGSETGRVHANAETLDDALRRAAGAVCLVVVGSGTMADIGKAVSLRLGGVPYIVIQTALSVNGFAGDQSVLLIEGVKRTVPTRWADVLIADTDILAQAPLALNAAGVGDLTAMFTAPADWLLAHTLGMADTYSEAVVTLVREHGTALLGAGPKVRERDAGAIEFVAKVLTLSGISMGVAGTTAPASGMEHTVSHLIEMSMNRRGLESPFHGAQVGVCTVLASLVWKSIRKAITGTPRPKLRFPGEEEMENMVRGAFRPLDSSGAMGEECWRQYRRKLDRWNRNRESLATVDWREVDRSVAGLLVKPSDIARALIRTGTPVRFRDLDPPVDGETVYWALTNCHLMRDRFTVADLAYFLGIWGPNEVEAILGEAASLGGGL